MFLKLAGHQALLAKDGDEALELFDGAQVSFDLILTDHNMPGMSGLDLVRRLRKKRFTGEIIVATGYAGSIEEQEYKRLGVAGIMEKPFHVAELRQRINCTPGCREQSWTGEKPPCPDSCWLRPVSH